MGVSPRNVSLYTKRIVTCRQMIEQLCFVTARHRLSLQVLSERLRLTQFLIRRRNSMRALGLLTLLWVGMAQASSEVIEVFRDPNCGCCTEWIEHLKESGFEVKDHVTPNMDQVKKWAGVPPELASCHTGIVQGKFIEGHVPAADIAKLLNSPLAGLAVPGMPVGSPGMEMGDRYDAYDVVGVNAQGQQKVITHYPAR